MNDIHGEVGIDVERLRAADPDGLYLFMLEGYRVGKKWLVPKLALLNYLYKGEGLQSA